MAKENLYHGYIATASSILQHYDGSTPFNDFLKKYFAQHKKFGARDRRQVTHLCYCYFRLGHSLRDLETEDRLLLALFLCSNNEHDIINSLKPEWKEHIGLPTEEKLKLLSFPFSVENIFPWQDELSAGIGARVFALSHFIQPDLFIRIRPGFKERVIKKLEQQNIPYCITHDSCISLLNTTKIDDLFLMNKEVVVQDYSSQRIAEFLQLVKPRGRQQMLFWDCCAASGGKSILAKDVLGDIDLTVSDIRSSIIHNLKQRFTAAGISDYTSFTADLSKPLPAKKQYDVVLADVPCSGSGTWGRTPEQLFYFDSDKIDYYSNLQKQIVQNVIPHVKQGGYFLYITCSVFKKENEEMVDFILAHSNLQLLKKEVLIGYDKRADTMFAALFASNP